eukprot:jgi/Tetstr1/420738/TSEL_011815.t1
MVRYLQIRYQLKVRAYVRPTTTREFYEAVQSAKIYVSPFGFGEAVGKDYETILSGAILVKPNSMRLSSAPDIYASGYSVSCRSDFADLGHVVLTVLNNLDKAQNLADKAYQNLAVVESSTARAARTEEYCKAEDGTSAKPPTGPFLPPAAHMVPREI